MEFGPLGFHPASGMRSQHVNMSDEVKFDNPYKQMLAPPSDIWGDVFYGRVMQEGYFESPIFAPVNPRKGRSRFWRDA